MASTPPSGQALCGTPAASHLGVSPEDRTLIRGFADRCLDYLARDTKLARHRRIERRSGVLEAPVLPLNEWRIEMAWLLPHNHAIVGAMNDMQLKHHERRKAVLGMPIGTASARLLKSLLFLFSQRLEMDNCYRCGQKITNTAEMSIEHKIAWLNHTDPISTFFDLDNIAFSHKRCNYSATESPHAKHRNKDEIRAMWAAAKRKNYTTEKRRQKFKDKGY